MSQNCLVGTLRRSVAAAALVVVLAGCRGAGWGYNAFGQVGDGTTSDRSTPTAQEATAWVTVDGGGFHSCGVGADGRAWCWGSNDDHQLGDGTLTDRSAPALVSGGATNYTSIDAGEAHTCAVRSDATLWCWGRDIEGQLGDGTQGSDSVVPKQVPGQGWRSVGAAYAHTCATRTDGTLWCWGENLLGQLGDGTDATYRPSPTQVAGTDWATVSGGSNHTCALRTDGTAWCWGSGDDGVLGQGNFEPSSTPVQVPGVWAAIESGVRHVCGLRADHTAWCWGYNADGQLGLGFDSGELDHVTTPMQLPGDDWLSISPGHGTTCALRLDRTAWCWGENALGALGDGTTIDSPFPAAVSGGGTWLEVSSGYHHVVGVRWPAPG